jgi:hypothetical protein
VIREGSQGWMRWAKRGLLYRPDVALASRHAYPPTPYRLDEATVRIYAAFVDGDGIGRAGYVDVSAEDPGTVLRVAPEPVLDVGAGEAFDTHGVMPTSLVRVGDELWMYYVGFRRASEPPYFQFQGLAVSHDEGESFSRVDGPILMASPDEGANRAYAFVVRDRERFRMWYSAGSEWTSAGDRRLPVYDIRYAESSDGVAWPDRGRVAIELSHDEVAVGRPWVFERGGRYRMLFSRRLRTGAYGAGYAESPDGVDWRRDDGRAGLAPSSDGWDSAMAAYASVLPRGDSLDLFYAGNDGGPTSIGWATLEEW